MGILVAVRKRLRELCFVFVRGHCANFPIVILSNVDDEPLEIAARVVLEKGVPLESYHRISEWIRDRC